MAVRRIVNRSRVRSGWRSSFSRLRRSSAGMTRSFETIVLSATVSTMIMLVAADSPPTKANSARAFQPCDSGSARTNISGSTEPAGKSIRPATATGSTNRLISSM